MRTHLIVLLFAVSCGAPPGPDGGTRDAGADDAGVDGAPHDADVDGGPRDANIDGGTPLCVLERAMGDATTPPGVVVFHIDISGGRFVGSPSIVRLPSGGLLASNDLFGLGQREMPPTLVHRSEDGGDSWRQIAAFDGQFWSSLFMHDGAVYVMGTSAEYGNVVIRRSDDEGETWTTPLDSASGLLAADAPYHTAPTPVVEHDGRIWRAIEWVREPITWPSSFEAALFWAESGSDLLRAESWHATQHHPFPTGDTGLGWLEGNPVVTRDGSLVNVLRVHVRDALERAAILAVTGTDTIPTLASEPTFTMLSGASKKFSIGLDAVSDRYLTLVNITEGTPSSPASVRNRLALASSADLVTWDYHVVLLSHEDATRHGFQYAAWAIDDGDLIFVSRTAYDDGAGGAENFHDANYLTFHRLRGFRECLDRAIAGD